MWISSTWLGCWLGPGHPVVATWFLATWTLNLHSWTIGRLTSDHQDSSSGDTWVSIASLMENVRVQKSNGLCADVGASESYFVLSKYFFQSIKEALRIGFSVLTQFLVLRLAPYIINSLIILNLFILTASCMGVSPSFSRWSQTSKWTRRRWWSSTRRSCKCQGTRRAWTPAGATRTKASRSDAQSHRSEEALCITAAEHKCCYSKYWLNLSFLFLHLTYQIQ